MESGDEESDYYDAEEQGSSDGEHGVDAGWALGDVKPAGVQASASAVSLQRLDTSTNASNTAFPPVHTGTGQHTSTRPDSRHPLPYTFAPASAPFRPQESLAPAQRRPYTDHIGPELQDAPSPPRRPATSAGDSAAARSGLRRTANHRDLPHHGVIGRFRRPSAHGSHTSPPSALHSPRRSLSAVRVLQDTPHTFAPALDSGAIMAVSRAEKDRNADLFLELAEDDDTISVSSRRERVPSRMSISAKRRSLPPEDMAAVMKEQRPKSSGQSKPIDARVSEHRQSERQRGAHSRASSHAGDIFGASARRPSRSHRHSVAPDRPPLSPSRLTERIGSPEFPQFGRRRPSFASATQDPSKTQSRHVSSKLPESYSDSPIEGSDPKQSLPDSASMDSQTAASTVWDELDDLKSRIKKLELTGRLPSTSEAAMSPTEQIDRPRTATTAPTTIDSSPKHDRTGEKKSETEGTPTEASANTAGAPPATNLHPLLHSALAKAKPLLRAQLYRQLEATAADALQLATMTGSAGPQGTTFSAASIINGVTVSDRHIRRKADTMCRNLTDLTLALCEGKYEASSVLSSPAGHDATPLKNSPTLRYSRSLLGASSSATRPMSRLEARRTSILGSQVNRSASKSPLDGSEFSASDDFTPSRSGIPDGRHRLTHYEDISGAEDEEPTVRPLSRARTDVGTGRARPAGLRDRPFQQTPQRSPSLRESLVARRVNAEAPGGSGNRQLSRVPSIASDAGRRRHAHDPSTPPVIEEMQTRDPEFDEDEEQVPPERQLKRKSDSIGRLSSRRGSAGLSNRTTGLGQRNRVAVE